MINFPKLRYPINANKGLVNEDRIILLAYDILWRMRNKIDDQDAVLAHDIDANLSNLGHHIEHVICGGDAALRFEGFDNANNSIGLDIIPDQRTAAEIIEEWNSITEKELG